MSWSRTTAIVTSLAQVTQLTGAQGLANIQDAGESTNFADLLLTASKGVYDRLVRDGLDPTKFESETVDAFERAVAYEFLHALALGNYLSEDEGEKYRDEAERQYRNVRPKSTDNSQPAGAGEALPGLTNQAPGFFGGDYFDDDITAVL